MKCGSHLSLEITELPPGTEWSAKCLGWCFARVGSYPGYWLSERGPMEIGPGEVVALSPLRDGLFRASQLGPVSLHHFRFSPQLASGLLAPQEHDLFADWASDTRFAIQRFAAETPGAALWTELLTQSRAGTGLLLRLDLLRVVVLLFAEALKRPAAPERAYLSARQKLRLLLNQTPELELLQFTSRDLARHCGVSVTQANRSFRGLFGVSLKARQQLIRLQNARQALMGAGRTMESVAEEAGFRNVNTFAAAFHKHFGFYPEGGSESSSSPGQISLKGVLPTTNNDSLRDVKVTDATFVRHGSGLKS